MKEFTRNNRLLSLCGLNCGLCSMHIGNYCPGCGGGEWNQPCRIAGCGIEHKVEYCFDCENYPCEKYEHVDDFDSFITHKNQKSDLEKAKKIGIEKYNLEQNEKIKILKTLLDNYNDVRRKTFFCLAVNLLELDDLKIALSKIEETDISTLTLKEKSAYAANLFLEIAESKNIELKLRKKLK